jgi:hypothetical protein
VKNKIIDDDYTTEDYVEDDILDIDEDELDSDEIEEDVDDFDIMFKDKQNKHKVEGKHRLERDIIFNGRIEIKTEDDACYYTTDFDYNEFSTSDILSVSDQDDVIIQKDLEHDIYTILSESTDLDFTQNRRKPKRDDFNLYYKILISRLKSKYTFSEIFVCLSYYFTDNIYNMFKILDKKYVSTIIKELKEKGYLRDIGNVDFI